jgi:steroid 5-alpha reductase family enzyme
VNADYPWGDLGVNLIVSALAVVVLIGAVMAYSIATKNHSIIDTWWGPGFVVVALVSYLVSAGSVGDDTRRLVVLLLTAAWGLRLGLYIGNRNRGHGEDKRYTALMRHQTGNLIVFLVKKIYGLQAALIWFVSLPVQVAMYESASLGVVGTVAIVVWAIGFLFEAVGDWQLSRFKADPANAGQIMDRGLWAWTRHPNYFGDTVVWFALWGLALGHWLGLLTVIAPIVMARLLVAFSGKKLLEKGMRRSKGAAYEDYIARTSGFFPMPPKRRAAGHVADA